MWSLDGVRPAGFAVTGELFFLATMISRWGAQMMYNKIAPFRFDAGARRAGVCVLIEALLLGIFF